MDTMEKIDYKYTSASIPGGGYVTGFTFQPGEEGLLYARTDIGGAYRFSPGQERWIALCDHVTPADLSETFPVALAVDERRPERLFMVSGMWREQGGRISVSEDYGKTFQTHSLPFPAHGNLPGRGTGERLIVDRLREEILYYASQTKGLWRSMDTGRTWSRVPALQEEYLTFVGQSPDGTALFVGTAGATLKKDEDHCGSALYVSYDRGESFETLWQPEYLGPENREGEHKLLRGLVAHRYAMDEKYLYVTFTARGRAAFLPELAYSCDTIWVTDGHVARYPWEDSHQGAATVIGQGEEISPFPERRIPPEMPEGEIGMGVRPFHPFGFGGISACPKAAGLLVCSTIRKADGDSIYRSRDYGETWEEILHGLDIGEMKFRTSYMLPEYNGGRNLIHWLSDIKIDPNFPDRAWFNTGTGVFRTDNLLGERVCFTDWCDGIEETVHINVYAPPAGETLLFDMVGDLGGFAFRDLPGPCENSFADEEGNRYITCMNADYSDSDPNLVVVTPRGNWTGKTKGGLILSRDNGKTFEHLPLPYGLSTALDQALEGIERPNVNSGWAAMSPNGKHIVWSVARGIRLPIELVVVSHDGGYHYAPVKAYDLRGVLLREGELKVFSDRVDSSLFYGFGSHSELYLSRDGGETYHQLPVEGLDQDICFTLIDCADQTEVRPESGRRGVIYFAAGEKGLWKLTVDPENGTGRAARLGGAGDVFYCLGLGLGRPFGEYFGEEKALYVAARIGGVYGFYRTLDQGRSFQRLNHDAQSFGGIQSIDGDKRVFGRFFIGSSTRGVLYGEPVGETPRNTHSDTPKTTARNTPG